MELSVGVDRTHFFDSTDHADLTAFATYYLAQNLNVVPDYARAKIAGTWYLLERVRATEPIATQWEIRSTANDPVLTNAQLRAAPVPVVGTRSNAGTDLAAGANHLTVGGSDGTNLRTIALDTAGIQRVVQDKSVDIAVSTVLTALNAELVPATALNGATTITLRVEGGTGGLVALQIRHTSTAPWETAIGTTSNDLSARTGAFALPFATALLINTSGAKFFRVVILSALTTPPTNGQVTLTYASVITGVQGNVVARGDIVHGATAGNALNAAAFESRTVNRTATADGQFARPIVDTRGLSVMRLGQVRELKSQSRTVITTTTETTILSAVASTFLDIADLVLANTGATATVVDIRDSTAGTIRASIPLAIGQTVVLDIELFQATINTSWTAQLRTATTVEITAVANRM
jgi:hypothetical protein